MTGYTEVFDLNCRLQGNALTEAGLMSLGGRSRSKPCTKPGAPYLDSEMWAIPKQSAPASLLAETKVTSGNRIIDTYAFPMSASAIWHQLSWRLDYFRIGDQPTKTTESAVIRRHPRNVV
jgi:hypothetical protein